MDITESYAPLNEAVDESAKDYAEAIVNSVKEADPVIEVEVDCEDAISTTGEKAYIRMIATKHGAVMVWPNFKGDGARACVYNRGKATAMILEDFSEEDMNEAPLLSTLVPKTEENVKLLGVFLTTDLGLQHQKGFASS